MSEQRSGKSSSVKAVSNYYLANGFDEDCHIMFENFVKANDISFNTFCKLWKDMQMSMIYHGRPSSAELFEYCEEVLIVAKNTFFINVVDFKKQVFGVYLLYALYNRQPYSKTVIKITSSEAEGFYTFKQRLKTERHYDTLYILCHLLCNGAIQICLSERDYAAERNIRSYYEGRFSNYTKTYMPDSSLNDVLGNDSPKPPKVSKKSTKSEPENVTLSENIDIYSLDENLQTYYKMKCRLGGVHASKPAPELDIIDHNVANKMAALLKKMCNISNSDSGDSPDNSTRRQIKRKAFETEALNLYAIRKSRNRQNKLLLEDQKENEERRPRGERGRYKKPISLFDADSDTD